MRLTLLPAFEFILSVIRSPAIAACPKFSEWTDATTHLNGPLVCAKIYSNDNCSGFPLLFGVNSSVPDLKHTISIMSLSTAFALIRPGCRLHIWSEPNYTGTKVDNFKQTSWHIGDAVKASATCDCMTNATDILTCKPKMMWSHVKRCDFSRSSKGGKCVYSSKLGFRFTSTGGAISDNDKVAMAAVIHDTFGYGPDSEIDFEENNGIEERLNSIDVDAGNNITIYRVMVMVMKAYYCGPHRLAVPEIKVESHTDNDAYKLFARSASTFTGEGIVTSPNYPNSYNDNVRKVYILQAQTPNGRIKLQISTFNTETTYDRLLILDGSFGTPLAYLTGENDGVGQMYRSTGPVMVLLFYTDASGTRPGWSADFSTEYD